MKLPQLYSGKSKDLVNVVIETPSGCRNKYDFDEKTKLFRLKKVLPAGMAFPWDMGFIPGTRGEDGDPLDALVFMEGPSYPGCFMECRLIGVIKAEQTQNGKKPFRNDRFLAFPTEMNDKSHIKDVSDLNKKMVESVIEFFENYNRYEDRSFKCLGVENRNKAYRILKDYID